MRTHDPILIAEAVRCAAEAYYPRCKTLRRRCAVVSVALALRLHGAGLRPMFVEGIYITRRRAEAHCWVECGERWYDLTRTQFCRAADPVTILEIGCPLYVPRRRLLDILGLVGLCVTTTERRAAKCIAEAARLDRQGD